jgi:PAT family beta-lactamase induction signal transducer AmpG
VLVEAFGWPTFFVLTVFAALPGLVLLYWLRKEVIDIDATQSARDADQPPKDTV